MNKSIKKNRMIFLAILAALETILSVFLFISFAANVIWPEKTRAAAGVAKILSYEGRLTDSSGNPLGGTGTTYCFAFSIFEDAAFSANTLGY